MTNLNNSKRIAKNTVFLYFRLMITLLVGLFTSRMILKALGVEDYGTYNVVCGVVVLMGYFNSVMSQGTSRFLTLGLGRGVMSELKNTFSACITIHVLLGLFTLVLGETIGLWFLNSQMNFPLLRMNAVNIIYQLSLFGIFVEMVQVPYFSTLIAHEKMSIYAYMSIFDAIMKLLIVFLLYMMREVDKLILYAFFYFCVTCVVALFYYMYSRRKFEECVFKFRFDKILYKEIFSYTGWNTIGTFAYLSNTQGVNILLNIFFGPAVNASRGLANTLSNIVNKFVTSFQTAVRPQVVKYFAQNNLEEMNNLVRNNSKYSAFLLMLVALPVMIETRFVINLWLGQVPPYVITFTQLTIAHCFIQSIDYPVGGGIHAYGKMKLPNLTSCVIYISILPVSYFFLKLGASPISAYIITICIYPFALICDLWILNKYTGFNISLFFREVIIKIFLVLIASAMIPLWLKLLLPYGLNRFLIVCISSFLMTAIAIYFIGIDKKTRVILLKKICTLGHLKRE